MEISGYLVSRTGRRASLRNFLSRDVFDGRKPQVLRNGFTLIEIILVVVILAIAAVMAIPMMTSGASMQIQSAANVIAADLEYAKSMAISRGQNYSVVFDKNEDKYWIEDQNHQVIAHPVKKGFPYEVNFRSDSRLDKVDIYDVNFNSTQTITFNYLGSPESLNNEGVITLHAGGATVLIKVEPVTGYISISG